MRVLAGITIGITLAVAWALYGAPYCGWLFTRILPQTPAGWAPKHRTWQHGIEVS